LDEVKDKRKEVKSHSPTLENFCFRNRLKVETKGQILNRFCAMAHSMKDSRFVLELSRDAEGKRFFLMKEA
jgi:hypothetical protein